MHLRTSTQKRNGKTYEYAQLVESHRGEDGKPTNRVVKHLGVLPDEVLSALRVALKAAKMGDALVLASEVANQLGDTIVSNLRFLDLVALLKAWSFWGLSELLDELGGKTRAAVPFSRVVAPLVLQRCCVPGSKIEATRWVQTTALPELLGFDPSAFNNTRVHRALETLHQHSEQLQERLSEKYLCDGGGGFAVLFLDVTDTYFEGIGCPLAEQTRTKAKIPNKRCLSIVLLVNEHGYPLRWLVLPGKTKDWHAMPMLLDKIGDTAWAKRTPLVMDRAMGNRSTVADLKASDLHFLTAAHVNSIEKYTARLPHEVFSNIKIEGTDESYERDIERVAQKARDAGLEEIHEHLFAIDLEVAVPVCEVNEPVKPLPAGRRRRRPSDMAAKLRMAMDIRGQLDKNPSLNHGDIAESLGCSRSRVSQLLALLRLSPEVQEQIIEAGKSFPLGEKAIGRLLKEDPKNQLAKLNAMLEPESETNSADTPANTRGENPIGKLRMVAYFNPRLFVDIRRRTTGHCDAIQKRVDELNAELNATKTRRKFQPTFRKFSRELERLNYLDTFEITLDALTKTSPSGKEIQSFQGQITRKDDVWSRRRRYDGFVLLLGHPKLQHSARQLVQFYRQKDTVEKAFQGIKSLIKLRPIWHETDPKVLAHVDLCMLSLLLDRTLTTKLRQAGYAVTAQSCIDSLATCHLNLRSVGFGTPFYEATQLTTNQKELLGALGLQQWGRNAYVRSQLKVRDLK